MEHEFGSSKLQSQARPAQPSVAVVGGGLAGIAAALALAKQQIPVTLYESKRRLGGRAGSFLPSSTQGSVEPVDYCQHVGMGCCHHLKQLIQWLNQEDAWEQQTDLHFYGPDGKYARMTELPWLRPPLHIGTWIWKWPGLGWFDRLSVARGMLKLNRLRHEDPSLNNISAEEWLVRMGQTPSAIRNFWSVIVVSALGESLSQVALDAVCKVMQDGFLRERGAYHLLVPQAPLDHLFNQRTQLVLCELGVDLRLSTPIRQVLVSRENLFVCRSTAAANPHSAVIMAVPWHQLDQIELPAECVETVRTSSQLTSSPISGIHTWWDQPWLPTPHAAIVGRMCQWVFPKSMPETEKNGGVETSADHRTPSTDVYYQIVISASHQLPKDDNSGRVGKMIHTDLSRVFPSVQGANLIRYKVVTDPNSVFSVNLGTHQLRPSTSSPLSNLFWAGDWTQTGWPATMEGAVISGLRASHAAMNWFRESARER